MNDVAETDAEADATLTVTFVTNGGKLVTAPAGSNLLRVSIRHKGGIPFKCGGALCGTCRCKIEGGLENLERPNAKERKRLGDEDIADGYRLACQTFMRGDVSVSWSQPAPPRQP